jgi:hypothetical protein
MTQTPTLVSAHNHVLASLLLFANFQGFPTSEVKPSSIEVPSSIPSAGNTSLADRLNALGPDTRCKLVETVEQFEIEMNQPGPILAGFFDDGGQSSSVDCMAAFCGSSVAAVTPSGSRCLLASAAVSAAFKLPPPSMVRLSQSSRWPYVEHPGPRSAIDI